MLHICYLQLQVVATKTDVIGVARFLLTVIVTVDVAFCTPTSVLVATT
jgi:hypothetical protein